MQTLAIEKMPTAITSDKYPIHKWFNFVAGYSPEYVDMVIEEFISSHRRKPTRIYDPFAGCATTCVVANELGIESIGVERNPFFYKIGLTKVNANSTLVEIDSIINDFTTILSNSFKTNYTDSLSDSARTFLLKLYNPIILEQLLQLRTCVTNYNGTKYYMGYTFVSKLMDFVTTAKTDGIYKAPTSTKNALNIYDAINKTKEIMTEGVEKIISLENKCQFIFGSSIEYEVESDSLDLVVFSPPYLNNFDFAEMTRMQLYFWEEASCWADISEKHRNHMLVNTTTALKHVKSKEMQSALRRLLPNNLLLDIDPIAEKLSDIRKVKSGKKEYNLLLYPYLAQMQQVLQRCYLGLKNEGEVHIVISDAAFYGIHIDTPEYIKKILSSIGYKNIQIELMRTRGDRWILEKRKRSNKQLGEFEIIARKESHNENII